MLRNRFIHNISFGCTTLRSYAYTTLDMSTILRRHAYTTLKSVGNTKGL